MSAVAVTIDSRTDRWIAHAEFDYATALEHGHDLTVEGIAPVPCPGTMVFADPEQFESGDPYVIVECDGCGYATGVKRDDVERAIAPLVAAERPDRWWDR